METEECLRGTVGVIVSFTDLRLTFFRRGFTPITGAASGAIAIEMFLISKLPSFDTEYRMESLRLTSSWTEPSGDWMRVSAEADTTGSTTAVAAVQRNFKRLLIHK